MLAIKIICVGRLKEKFYVEACREYEKRLGPFCRLEIEELPEQRLGEEPFPRETEAALEREGAQIVKKIPAGAYVISMCVEGQRLPSPELANIIRACADRGRSRLCFIIGGSCGLHESVKELSDLRLSMSDMTFPHHLARVMLLEQLYRSMTILQGKKYHK